MLTFLIWISTILLVWISFGCFIAFIKLFIYFKGPKHMIEVYKSNKHTKKSAELIMQNANGNYVRLAVGYFVMAIFIPPLAFLDLYMDFVLFTWDPFVNKKNTP